MASGRSIQRAQAPATSANIPPSSNHVTKEMGSRIGGCGAKPGAAGATETAAWGVRGSGFIGNAQGE
ncbi:hypothetical protein D3C72_2239990 [compost metagenome]